MTKTINYVYIICFAALLAGCDGDDPDRNTESKDRVPMLTNWVDNIIVPAYNNFKVKLDDMKAKGDAFGAAPSQTSLVDFRQAWADAYVEWQKVSVFEVGPADKYSLRNFFNIYPTDVSLIHQHISDPTVNLDVATTYAAQGFPALDYLINGVGETDEAIVAFYTSVSDGASRLDYVNRLTSRMVSLLTNVVSDWDTYRDTFISKTGLDVGSSTGLMVNAYVLYYERYIRTGKFGIPSGAMTSTGGTLYPDKAEAVYKGDISLTLARTAHQTAIDFFNGKNVTTGAEGPSLKSYLDALGAEDAASGTALSDIINNQFTEANAKMDVLSENFYQEVQTNNNAMIDVFNAMQKAVRLLKVDMTSAMSVTITYTDNDGD